MLKVKEQKVEEDFCLWLGYDGEDAVQVVWILVRETWRLDSAIGGGEVSGAVLRACSGRKKPTALATMKLNANSLTLWKPHFELTEVRYSLLEMFCNPRAVLIPARTKRMIFKAFHR